MNYEYNRWEQFEITVSYHDDDLDDLLRVKNLS